MTTNKIIEALSLLRSLGVRVVYDCLNYTERPLGDSEIADLLTGGPEYMEARMHGLSIAEFRAWKEASTEDGYQCEAITRAGRQCRNRILAPFNPADWKHRPLYCWTHGD